MSRHGKYGDTVFHLEPNVKETPGGLRDYNVACWLALISAMDKLRDWPDLDSLLSPQVRKQFEPALDFLMAVRCFLHFRHGRDDNMLTWEAQDEAAAARIGAPDGGPLSAADWMRVYFSHARAIHRVAAAAAGGNSRGPVFAVPPVPELAFAAFECGFLRGGWPDFPAAAQFRAGPGVPARHLPLHGPPWLEAQHVRPSTASSRCCRRWRLLRPGARAVAVSAVRS